MIEKRKNKKNKILLIFALIFTEKSSLRSFQPLQTTKAVKFVSPYHPQHSVFSDIFHFIK